MNRLARTLANTSTQIAKIDHHHSRRLTHSQEPVQNTILPGKNHRLDYWSKLGEYQHLLLWNSLFLHWETTSDHRLKHLTGFLERTLLLQTGGRRRGPTAPRSQDLDGFFEPCARTDKSSCCQLEQQHPSAPLWLQVARDKPPTSTWVIPGITRQLHHLANVQWDGICGKMKERKTQATTRMTVLLNGYFFAEKTRHAFPGACALATTW